MSTKPDLPQPAPCAEKLTFDSRREATGAAAAIHHQRGTKLKPYKCQHCDLWHLTSRK